MKRILKDYFSFSRNERTAILVLLLLMGIFVAAPYLYSPEAKPPADTKLLEQYLNSSKVSDTAESGTDNTGVNRESTELTIVQPKPFLFDPNSLPAEGWQKLGIRDKTIKTILNFRNKGGRFRLPEDLGKIWGLPAADANRLIPYVRIEQKQVPFRDFRKEERTEGKTVIDINTATAEEWESLPGIGTVLAGRIIKFRERLGGFISLEQVRKTYGISDSVYQRILPQLRLDTVAATTATIDLNTASVQQLTAKTGITGAIARAIVIYRKEYGPFQAVADLKKIVVISEAVFQQISPHVHVK